MTLEDVPVRCLECDAIHTVFEWAEAANDDLNVGFKSPTCPDCGAYSYESVGGE
jgi:ribosomal protein S27E